MTVGAGLLALTLIMLVHSVRNFGAYEGVNFASPEAFARELEVRNARELRRNRPIWPLIAVVGFCSASSLLAVASNPEAFASNPAITLSAVLFQAVILAGVGFWRHRELKRLEQEEAEIAELRRLLEEG